MSHILYNKLAQTLTKNFKRRKKRNIVKFGGKAKIPMLWLLVLRQPTPVKFTKAGAKLSVITVTKKEIMPRTIPSLQLITLQIIND